MFRCENIYKGPETVGNRGQCTTLRSSHPWRQNSNRCTLPAVCYHENSFMALLLHLCEAAVSHRWQRLFTRMTGPVHLSDGTDGALFLHGYCRKYIKIMYPIWQLASDELASARKNEKNTLWGYRKLRHHISLYISIMRWRDKKHCSAETKNNSM